MYLKKFSTWRLSNTTSTDMNKPLTFVSVAAAGLLAYAVYFDYTRRNDPQFRKLLKKRAVQMEKEDAKAKKQATKAKRNVLKKALLADLAANPPPKDASQKESYFLEQISMGERYAPMLGGEVHAALCFYKALSVYPNPTDVLGVYKNSVPAHVYELVVELISIQAPNKVDEIIPEAKLADQEKEFKPADLD
uniref:Mitochondrial import receptor subunit n=1 Tax=Candidozyma auris TaxID=498019 RepID=A0A0L0NT96_CANAR